MKRETITTAVTAIVFFGAGFLAGYIYDSQKHWNTLETSGTTGGQESRGERATGAPSAGGTVPTLPEGHPPIDNAALVKALEEQAAQNPRDPNPPLRLANFYYDQRQFEQAVKWYQKALELDPRNVNARTDLGTAYFNLGLTRDALREYQRSLDIDPGHEPTMFNIILVNLQGRHDLTAARAAWERLYRRNPNYPGLERLKESVGATSSSAGDRTAKP